MFFNLVVASNDGFVVCLIAACRRCILPREKDKKPAMKSKQKMRRGDSFDKTVISAWRKIC